MFENCNSLLELNLDIFNTSKVIDMKKMFSNCESLTSLKINFDTSNVTNMELMFYNCKNLTSLDLSSFNIEEVLEMNEMF